MRYLGIFLVLVLAISCTPDKKGDPTRFVHGTFRLRMN